MHRKVPKRCFRPAWSVTQYHVDFTIHVKRRFYSWEVIPPPNNRRCSPAYYQDRESCLRRRLSGGACKRHRPAEASRKITAQSQYVGSAADRRRTTPARRWSDVLAIHPALSASHCWLRMTFILSVASVWKSHFAALLVITLYGIVGEPLRDPCQITCHILLMVRGLDGTRGCDLALPEPRKWTQSTGLIRIRSNSTKIKRLGEGYFEIFSYYDVIVKLEKYELIFDHVDNPCEDEMTQICILAKFLGYACTYWCDSNVKQIFLNITVEYG